jgi:hypothetical protein
MGNAKRKVNGIEYEYAYSNLQIDTPTHTEIKILASKEMMSIKNMVKKMYKFYIEKNNIK